MSTWMASIYSINQVPGVSVLASTTISPSGLTVKGQLNVTSDVMFLGVW